MGFDLESDAMQEMFYKLQQERQQQAEEAAKWLVEATRGMGLDGCIAILCREAGIDVPMP